jgi:hypothetical protein
MSRDITVDSLFFGVEQLPVEAVANLNGKERRIVVPGKKALLNAANGTVLGIVSRDYRVVTNAEAVEIAREVCAKAFPGIAALEWDASRASAPRTLSYAFIDLMHRTHVLNYMGNGSEESDPFTPFLRVTNSFNGARALRFDIGFLRQHCSNGVIFEEKVATFTAAHNVEALEKLKLEITARSLDQLWKEFTDFIGRVRSVAMSAEQSERALAAVLHLPGIKEDDSKIRREEIEALNRDTGARLTGYRSALGKNAYAVFNTLTDIAARPPDSRYFQKDRDTLEKRAGRWLRRLSVQHQASAFDLEKFITKWGEDLAPSRNFRQN